MQRRQKTLILLVNKFFETPPHRGGRVLSFFSSRRNWDSPNPSPACEWASPTPRPVLGGGTHSLAREGLGESQFRRGDTHCGTLYIYVLWDTALCVCRMYHAPCSTLRRLPMHQIGVSTAWASCHVVPPTPSSTPVPVINRYVDDNNTN